MLHEGCIYDYVVCYFKNEYLGLPQEQRVESTKLTIHFYLVLRNVWCLGPQENLHYFISFLVYAIKEQFISLWKSSFFTVHIKSTVRICTCQNITPGCHTNLQCNFGHCSVQMNNIQSKSHTISIRKK